MTSVKILYWYDIPVQVKAEDHEGRAGVQLSSRFQEAIDEAAMAANLIGDDDYTNGFKWRDAQERDGTAQSIAEAVAAELEAKYAEIDWRATARTIRARREK